MILIDIARKVLRFIKYYQYQNISKTSRIANSCKVYNKRNIILEDNANIDDNALIMNTNAKFIIKKNSGAAVGLSVITGNHMSPVGRWFKSVTDADKLKDDPSRKLDQDVIVDEDVWIGSNVTLLNGVHIGRGAEIGSGTVVRKSIPPYAVVIGNPAKIVGFKFTPEEIIEHEKFLYPEEERFSFEFLEKNYNKYFLSRINEIKEWTRL